MVVKIMHKIKERGETFTFFVVSIFNLQKNRNCFNINCFFCQYLLQYYYEIRT